MNKLVNLSGIGEKKWGCELLAYISAKQKKPNRLLTSTVSCETRSCSIRIEKKNKEKKTW